jgi:hypothetical protein
VSGIILGIRSLIFTSVCARVHREATSPINTLYRSTQGSRFGSKTMPPPHFLNDISPSPQYLNIYS